MAEVKWIKITTSMFEDEKIDFIESLPEADAILVIWIKLLTQAGRNNVNGFVFLTENIPYTEEMLSHKFRRPLNTVRLALNTLEQLEMIIFEENGFLRIANWGKHQNVEGLDKIREQTRKRVARHREKQQLIPSNATCNVTVTQGNATELELEEELDIDKKEIKDIVPDGTLSQPKANKYIIFFETYNNQKIIIHQKLTKVMKQAIDRALKKNSQEEILKAIVRYGQAYNSDYKFAKFKMTLDKFLTQSNGYQDWLDEGQKWINYSDHNSKGDIYGKCKQSDDKSECSDIAEQAGILSF